MNISIYSTLAREIRIFEPLEPGKIRLYVCGVTVYDYCHLGHARAFVDFDLVVRFLRFIGWDVTFVRNITDVDDKIIKRAAEEQASPAEIAERFTRAMHEDFERLGMLTPDQEPRATEYMDEIIAMIGELVDKGFAYQAPNGDLYYRVGTFADYGRLSGHRLDELVAGARVEIEQSKEDPRDFALWKAVEDEGISWPSPWGPGRPGWHIECSAMSRRCLGRTFDIHGGGADLIFPHHENEIAQSEAANGCTFARYWMHVGPLRIDGDKMSKSLGNFFTIREVLEVYAPEVVRLFLISSHYRSPINYSEAALIEARNALERLYQCLRQFDQLAELPREELLESSSAQAFITALSNDFNSREALAVLFDLVARINAVAKQGDLDNARQDARVLKQLAAVLGILQQDPTAFLQGAAAHGLDTETIDSLIAERQQAKKNGDYGRADQIRQELAEQGVQLEDSHTGTRWRRI